ncbi:MAG: hypothetical protein QM786_00215 [Breznakibacter sp.]
MKKLMIASALGLFMLAMVAPVMAQEPAKAEQKKECTKEEKKECAKKEEGKSCCAKKAEEKK